jgi:hypothetical protein
MTKKRLVIISDLHCGDRWGLREGNKLLNKFYLDKVKELRPVDVLLLNGDGVQGTMRGKSNDVIEPDLGLQAEMCIDYLGMWKAKTYLFTMGTGIHVSEGTDWEKWIAREMHGLIKAKQIFDINGVRFNAKHHTSKTSIPHGQGTLLLKRVLWENIKSQLTNTRKSDVFVRSHIHEFCQIKNRLGFAVTCPALQLPRGAYGTI